jgi:hypothetical protein
MDDAWDHLLFNMERGTLCLRDDKDKWQTYRKALRPVAPQPCHIDASYGQPRCQFLKIDDMSEVRRDKLPATILVKYPPEPIGPLALTGTSPGMATIVYEFHLETKR